MVKNDTGQFGSVRPFRFDWEALEELCLGLCGSIPDAVVL